MRKLPQRRTDEITQPYNDGLVRIYSVTDGAEPGYQPKPVLHLKGTLRYEERQLGVQRYYSAKQNNIRVERIIRVPRTGQVDTQDVAVTEDGRQYSIEWVQSVRDVWPQSADLTLTAVRQQYDVPEADT